VRPLDSSAVDSVGPWASAAGIRAGDGGTRPSRWTGSSGVPGQLGARSRQHAL